MHPPGNGTGADANKSKGEASWLNRFLWKFRPAIHVPNCVPVWSRLLKNTRKRVLAALRSAPGVARAGRAGDHAWRLGGEGRDSGEGRDNAKTPEAIRAIRNLLFWRHILGSIEPEWFKGIFQAIPEGIAQGDGGARPTSRVFGDCCAGLSAKTVCVP